MEENVSDAEIASDNNDENTDVDPIESPRGMKRKRSNLDDQNDGNNASSSDTNREDSASTSANNDPAHQESDDSSNDGDVIEDSSDSDTNNWYFETDFSPETPRLAGNLVPYEDTDGSELDIFSTSSSLYNTSESELGRGINIESESDQSNDSIEKISVLNKSQPKENWFVLPEISNRQIGYGAKMQNSQLFEKRCLGSLHYVQRLDIKHTLPFDTDVNCVNFHPNNNVLVGAAGRNLKFWDSRNGRQLSSFNLKLKRNNLIVQTKFMPLPGDLNIATSTLDGQVQVSQVSMQEGLRCTRKLGSHQGICRSLSVLNDQPNIILSAGKDGVILRHDLRSSQQEELLTVKRAFEKISLKSVNINPLKSNEFCVAAKDYVIRTYDQRKCSENNVLNRYYPSLFGSARPGIYYPLNAIYNHNGTEILATYGTDGIYLFDTYGNSGSFVHYYEGHYNVTPAVDFYGPKSEYIISSSDGGKIFIWEKNSESIVGLLSDPFFSVSWVESHPHLPMLCSISDSDVKLWKPVTNIIYNRNEMTRTEVKRIYKNRSLEDMLEYDNRSLRMTLREFASGNSIRRWIV